MKAWVGSAWPTPDIEDRYESLGSFDEVIKQILNQQIADLAAQPSSISVPGLSISNTQNLQSLEQTLSRFLASGGSNLDVVTSAYPGTTQMVRTQYR